MQIELTPEQASFIELGVQEGRYRDREEAVRQALADWERRERQRVELLASLEMADASLDANNGEEYDTENLSPLVEGIRARGRHILSRSQ
jgi:putative addiction module CopG family antidote